MPTGSPGMPPREEEESERVSLPIPTTGLLTSPSKSVRASLNLDGSSHMEPASGTVHSRISITALLNSPPPAARTSVVRSPEAAAAPSCTPAALGSPVSSYRLAAQPSAGGQEEDDRDAGSSWGGSSAHEAAAASAPSEEPMNNPPQLPGREVSPTRKGLPEVVAWASEGGISPHDHVWQLPEPPRTVPELDEPPAGPSTETELRTGTGCWEAPAAPVPAASSEPAATACETAEEECPATEALASAASSAPQDEGAPPAAPVPKPPDAVAAALGDSPAGSISISPRDLAEVDEAEEELDSCSSRPAEAGAPAGLQRSLPGLSSSESGMKAHDIEADAAGGFESASALDLAAGLASLIGDTAERPGADGVEPLLLIPSAAVAEENVIPAAAAAAAAPSYATGTAPGSAPTAAAAPPTPAPVSLNAQELEVAQMLKLLEAPDILQDIVSQFPEPMQRYIRERAIDMLHAMDESLERQGLGGAGLGARNSGGGGEGSVRPTPSKQAAAAALVLAVAASGNCRWPYSMGGAAPGAGGAGAEPGCSPAPFRSPGLMDWLFRTPAHNGPGAPPGAPPGSRAAASGLVPNALEHRLDGEHQYPTGPRSARSYTLCYGSVQGTGSQAQRAPGSITHTSGALSARAMLVGSKRTPRSVESCASAAGGHGLSPLQRRRFEGRLSTAVEPTSSAAGSNCNTAASKPPGKLMRRTPQPAPRGLGCALGQPRRAPNVTAKPTPSPPQAAAAAVRSSKQRLGLDLSALSYLDLPYLDVPKASARPGREGSQTARSRPAPPPAAPAPQAQPKPTGYASRAAAGNNAAILKATGAAAKGAGKGLPQPGWQRLQSTQRGAAITDKQRVEENMAALEAKRRRIMAAALARAQPDAARAGVAAGADGTPELRTQRAAYQATRGAAAMGGYSYRHLLKKSSGGGAAATPPAGGAGAGGAAAGNAPGQVTPRRNPVRRSASASPGRLAAAVAAAASPRNATSPRAALSPRGSTSPRGVFSAREMLAEQNLRVNQAAATAAAIKAAAAAKDASSSRAEESMLSGLLWGGGSLAGLVPYTVVHAYPVVDGAAVTAPLAQPPALSIPSAKPSEAAAQPLHTALKLHELLAGFPAASSGAAAAPAAVPAADASGHSEADGVLYDRSSRPSAPASPVPAVSAGMFAPAPEAADTAEHHEPATAFVIVSRRNTVEDMPDMGALPGGTNTAPASSLLDLSSLLPAPAWRNARSVTEGAAREEASRGGAAADAKRESEAGARAQDAAQAAAAAAMDAEAPLGRPSAGSAGGAGPSRKWTREGERMVVPDRQQLRATSPNRARYAAEAQPQQPAEPPRAAAAGTTPAAGAKKTAAGRGVAAKPRQGQGSSQAPRSRSAPSGRRPAPATAKAASTRGGAPQPAAGAGRPGAKPQQRPAPGTPVRAVPSSPPPPMQSTTPQQLQQHSQQSSRRDHDTDSDCESSPVTVAEDMAGAPGAGAGSPHTPTNKRIHVRSPEDMPLSAAAQQSLHTRLAAADHTAAAATTTATPCAGNTAAGWTAAARTCRAASAVKPPHKPHSTPAALSPQQVKGNAPLSRTGAATAGGIAPPVWRPAASAAAAAALIGRRSPGGGTAAVEEDDDRAGSPGPQRGAGHDCTPNILSPPRNYEKPWATPSRDALNLHPHASTDADLTASPGPGAARRHVSPAPQSAARRRNGVADKGTPKRGTAAREHASPAPAPRGPDAGAVLPCDAPLQPALSVNRSLEDYGRLGAMVSPSASMQGPLRAAAGAGAAAPVASTRGSRDSVGSGRANAPTAATTAASCGSGGAASVAAAAVEPAGRSYTGQHLARAAAAASAQLPAPVPRPAGVRAPGQGAHSGPTAHLGAVDEQGEVDPHGPGADDCLHGTAELGAMDDDPDATSTSATLGACAASAGPAAATATLSASLRTVSGGAAARSGSRTASNHSGGTGAGPAAALRASTRSLSTAAGGPHLVLLRQAAWAGLAEPRVADALCTLAAGIAVLDPAPTATVPAPATPPTAPAEPHPHLPPGLEHEAVPSGCFGNMFRRGSHQHNHHPVAAAAAAAAVQQQQRSRSQAPAQPPLSPQPQKPVLLRVHVVGDTVELALLRPKGPGATLEQRVQVAALSGLRPAPLATPRPSAGGDAAAGAGAAAAAAAAQPDPDDADVADPSSRWLQLVAMDGGVMRLSACSPADHARLVLGLNAALLMAAGAASEDAALAALPLRGGLAGGR
ncbi:hypothetical protein HYH03_009728 [Edaphochlamys debaryana]|uniref:Uncharacterized protein n=1 Tax=Edaphochlamys debaryana TaxID=47281 RepID=A0A836BY73_9CHLO|nr:hypothetical protein HYH03_009728 [Edaphochlamys debaryana]|eukprot:KAG2491998.1 hypothetical protein HYH03_009728 [Edaphochlamys debaryana]